MKRNFWLRQLPMALLVTGAVLTAAAWQTGPAGTQQKATDTIPDRTKKVKDIDQALEELEKGRMEMELSLKEIDMEKIQKEIRESMKNIDMSKIQVEMEKALKEVDAAKIQADVQKALKEIDFDKIQKDLQKSLSDVEMSKAKEEIARAIKEIDMSKIKMEVDASVSKIDMDKLKKEMERIRDVDMKKIEEDLKKIGPEIEESMKSARESMEQAKKELTGYKQFIDGLEKDGLINKKEAYSIQYKDGGLTINGKQQPSSVVEKYSSFLKGHSNFTIRKDKEDFNIDKDR